MTDLAQRLIQSEGPVMKPPLRVAGLTLDFAHGEGAGIPALWGELFGKLPFSGQDGGVTYGVCAAAPQGGLRYWAGAGLAEGAPEPEGLAVIALPARPYLVFSLVTDGSSLHPVMQAVVREIWGSRMPASGFKAAMAPELEVYGADFRPDQAGHRLEWWIPVEA